MSKRRLETKESQKGKKTKLPPSAAASGEQKEIWFSEMPVSSELLKIQKYDASLDMVLYLDFPKFMRENIKSLYSFYKQISYKSVATTLIQNIHAGRGEADYIGHHLALLAEVDESGEAIKQVIEVIADPQLKAKSIGVGLYRLAKAESDETTIKRTLAIIEDQSLKTKSISIGLYLLFKEEVPVAIVGHLLSAIEDKSVITQVVNTSFYWLCKDKIGGSQDGEVAPDSNTAQVTKVIPADFAPVIVAGEDASGLLGEGGEL